MDVLDSSNLNLQMESHQSNYQTSTVSRFSTNVATVSLLLIGALSAANALSVSSSSKSDEPNHADKLPKGSSTRGARRDSKYYFFGNHQAQVRVNIDDMDVMMEDVMPLITAIGKLNLAFEDFDVKGRSCQIRVICESQQLSLNEEESTSDSLVARVVDALSSIQGPAILTLQKRNFPTNFVQLIYNYVEASVVGKMGLDCVTGAIEQCKKSTADFMQEKMKKEALKFKLDEKLNQSAVEETSKIDEDSLNEAGLVDKFVEV